MEIVYDGSSPYLRGAGCDVGNIKEDGKGLRSTDGSCSGDDPEISGDRGGNATVTHGNTVGTSDAEEAMGREIDVIERIVGTIVETVVSEIIHA